MGSTQRFGLSTVGGPYGGSLTEDGYKFTGHDRVTLDRILEAFENHAHEGGQRLDNPTAAPALALDTVGGTLLSGVTYHYRVAYIDQFGLETAASAEASVVMPTSVDAPTSPLLTAQVGGTLTQGVYYYALTAEAGSEQTQLGPAAVITLLPDRGTVVVELPALPAGADSFAIWRQGPDESGYTKVATGIVAATWTDDGTVPADPCACDPENLPPTQNRTNAANTVAITIPDSVLAQQADSPIRRWRVYRSTVSGGYGPSSLVAEVTDSADAGHVDLQYIDRGGALLAGAPLEVSQALSPSLRVTALAGGSGGGHFFLNDSSGQTWRVLADLTGQLETRILDTPMSIAPEAVNLRDTAGTVWRLTVTTVGQLETTDNGATASHDEYLYEVGGGPHIPTPDATDTYQLGVDTSGALTTTGGQTPASTLVVGDGVRKITVAAAPPSDGREGDFWVKPGAGEAAGANPHATTLADLAGHVTDQDIEITSATRGVILRAPGGGRFRITVGDDGALTTAAL